MNNFYWPVYKNLENELIELSNLIHIDDFQLEIYSIRIAELLIRTSVEIESLSKKLYFQYGGTKLDDSNLFFDTDCLDLLESKFIFSKKQVQVSASNFHFSIPDNQILTPLKKANKRGSSSSDWLKAYQAVKHNRATSLSKANLKHFIRALAALYLLNIYNNDLIFSLDKDSSGVNFDRNLGSSIFSIKIHINITINANTIYTKNSDFEECAYLLKVTDDTRIVVQKIIEEINQKTTEKTNLEIINQIKNSKLINFDDIKNKIKELNNELYSKMMTEVMNERKQIFNKSLSDMKYEAILNKNQF